MIGHKFSKQEYRYGFSDAEKPVFTTKPGISERVVEEISSLKSEPSWMRGKRLAAYKVFAAKQLPTWGGDLSGINFNGMTYYARPADKQSKTWSEVPGYIRETFDKLGVPEAERKLFAGVGAQYDSEVIYHRTKEELSRQGVIFCDTDTAVREYPDIVKQYFGTVVPVGDNKFAALNTAAWSGGSFIYVPKGVKVTSPLQAYFRINLKNFGQFERTLIIADEGSDFHYIEGCTAPVYSTDSLHAAVVEIIAHKNAHVRYTTIQNWSHNVYNLVTKRARAEEGAYVEWIDGNLGSKLTMKYPSVYMTGRGARADVLSVALAGPGQVQDAGAKVVHMAPDTRSNIVSKSVSFGGGRTAYRGLAKVVKGAERSRLSVRCDAMILDSASRSDTYPTMSIAEENVRVEHEATVSRMGEKELFYMNARGLSAIEAQAMVVAGFFEPLSKVLPIDYAIELNRLIEMELEGSVG